MSSIEGLEIYGPPKERRAGVITFNLADIHPHDVATAVDTEGVLCKSWTPLCTTVNEMVECIISARASFYVYNTKEDVDQLVEALKQTKEFFSYEF